VVVNGVITCFLASFGLIGNSMFVYQIHKSRYFSRRLASHLTMLCVWDMALLLCCLLTYGIISLYYGIIPFFGIVAYLLYFFQPFASFCVTGTIWQVLAITIERYTAVSRPLEQRTRNAQFSVPSITACIVTGAFLLNMVVVPIERKLTDCYEFTQNGFQIHTMIVQQPIVNNQFYAILVHLIPDIIFRAPTPIVAIAFLTVRTLQICSRRQVGTQTIQHGTRRNVPYMLTVRIPVGWIRQRAGTFQLLNVKFCLCNTLYLFNTILMEIMGYGGKTSSQQTELEMEQYVRSLYLTDLSNILLALHSATNFLIFYHWPTFRKQYKKYSNLTMTTVVPKSAVFDAGVVETLLTRFSANKQRICVDILATLCVDSSKIAKVIADAEDEHVELSKEYFEQNASLLKHAVALADVIGKDCEA
ncbi:Protein C39B10.1, partial [Aphelenchoides avenae]